ncbi:MAG: hypothetical protein IPL12_05115 [Bacteroidetes bacterium]|nr:hypothetical protein [Bacteroidota bacterium]
MIFFFSNIIYAQNSSYVNVFNGTDGRGHTFPGPSMPFGMVQPAPIIKILAGIIPVAINTEILCF